MNSVYGHVPLYLITLHVLHLDSVILTTYMIVDINPKLPKKDNYVMHVELVFCPSAFTIFREPESSGPL